MASSKTCLYSIPAFIQITWYLFFILLGFCATTQDWSLKDHTCGQTTHVMKYALLNLVFALCCFISYAVFPAGGEGARARAVLLIAFHFGFGVWGLFMLKNMQDICTIMLQDHYVTLNMFIQFCVGHNTFFFVALAIHETFLPEATSLCGFEHSDYTLMPIRVKANNNQWRDMQGQGIPPAPGTNPTGSAAAPKYSQPSQMYQMPGDQDTSVPPLTDDMAAYNAGQMVVNRNMRDGEP